MRRLESQSAVNATAAATTMAHRWVCMAAPRWLIAALAALILAAPAWLYWVELGEFWLWHDDFDYISQSHTWPTTVAHLLEPHNSHVVPIFRVWTFLLVSIARRLPNLQLVFAAATYVGLVAAMLAMGLVVGRETRMTAAGLSAMALLGISTVLHRVVTWYSAGQALWAGTAILLTVALAQAWSRKGGITRLVAVALSAFIAPAVWSGGLLAGPAAVAYLTFAKERRPVRPALLLTVVSLISALLVIALAWGRIRESKIVWEPRLEVWPRPIQAILHTTQALVEACVCGNLGLEVATTERQAMALLFALIVFHAWSRRGAGRWNSLEATGATIAVGSCLLVYFFRGNMPYRELRALGWYHAIPQIGAILFAAGWWSAVCRAATPNPRITLAQAAAVLLLVVVFCWIHLPREELLVIRSAPALPPGEAERLPTTALLAGRAHYYKGEFHDRQYRALVRLERLDRMLSRLNASPESLRAAFGWVSFPGIPDEHIGCDALSLLTPRSPNPDTLAELASHSAELVELLRPEPATLPFWLAPKDPAGSNGTDQTSESLKNHH